MHSDISFGNAFRDNFRKPSNFCFEILRKKSPRVSLEIPQNISSGFFPEIFVNFYQTMIQFFLQTFLKIFHQALLQKLSWIAQAIKKIISSEILRRVLSEIYSKLLQLFTEREVSWIPSENIPENSSEIYLRFSFSGKSSNCFRNSSLNFFEYFSLYFPKKSFRNSLTNSFQNSPKISHENFAFAPEILS